MKPYFEEDGITIYHGDCLDAMGQLSGVDLVVTSPPYNLGTHPSGRGSGMHAGSGYTANGKTWTRVADLAGGYGTHTDDMPQEDYDKWQRQCVYAMWRTLSWGGAIFYNHKPRPFNGQVKLPTDYGSGLPLRQVVIWDRGVGMNFAPTHFLPKSEWICIWADAEWRLADRTMSSLGDVWHIAPESSTEHPAPFPMELASRAIGATTAKLVLDPFMGSGTTLRAAKDLGRKAIGIEIEERYCEIAAKRLSQKVLPFEMSPTPAQETERGR